MTSTALSSVPTGTYAIDTTHSEVGFSVRHAGVSKVRGRFAEVTGTITIAEPFTSSSVSVEIASSSVSTGNAQRDAHLVSADFWDAESKPTWTFVSTSLEGDGEEFVVHGDLTINGVTKSVSLATEFNGTGPGMTGAPVIGFSASTDISRKEYGLTWNALLEGGGVVVGDKVTIALEVEAGQQEA